MRKVAGVVACTLLGSSFLGFGCSSSPGQAQSSQGSQDAGAADAATSLDAGADAAAPPIPDGRRLTKLSGSVLANPVIVPLFWGDDGDRARTESMLAQIPGSDWWKLVSEYGVGELTVAPSVTIGPTAPGTFSLNDVEATIEGMADGTHGPAPNGNQIYALYLPTQTNVLNTDGSPFCQAGGGYHESTTDQATNFAYSVVPHCAPQFDSYALAATHELIEAATDPYPLVTPAWAATDPGHVGWRGEIGDLCDYEGSLTVGGAPLFGTHVERVFSNAKAAKGGDPCLPDLGFPYFNAAPVPTDDITVTDALLGSLKGRGVKVAMGETKKVDVVLYADCSVPAWGITLQTMAQSTQQASTSIDVTIDQTEGQAGDVLHLTITRKAKADPFGDVVFLYSADKTEFWNDTITVTQ